MPTYGIRNVVLFKFGHRQTAKGPMQQLRAQCNSQGPNATASDGRYEVETHGRVSILAILAGTWTHLCNDLLKPMAIHDGRSTEQLSLVSHEVLLQQHRVISKPWTDCLFHSEVAWAREEEAAIPACPAPNGPSHIHSATSAPLDPNLKPSVGMYHRPLFDHHAEGGVEVLR